MNTNLMLKLTGLCAFVPNDAGGYRVVLVNASTPMMMGGTMMPAHVAAVLVRVDEYASTSTWKPDKPFDGSQGGYEIANMYLFYLSGGELTILPSGSNISIPAVADPTLPCPIQGVDHHSFRWVAKMSAMGAGKMSSGHYQGANPNTVLSYLDLPPGVKPSTWEFALTADGKNVLKWAFTDSLGNVLGTPAALAEVVVVGISLSSSQVTLRYAKGDIVLNPAAGRATVWIVNMPESDILNAPSGAPRGADTHFEMFYGMADAPGTVYIPNPTVDLCGPPPVGAISNPKCPPALFDAHA